MHRKGGPDELAKSLAQVPEAVKVGLPPDMKNMCKNVTAIADGLRSGKQPANLPDSRHVFEEWAAAGPRAKKRPTELLGGDGKALAAPTAENWEALMCQQRSRRAKEKHQQQGVNACLARDRAMFVQVFAVEKFQEIGRASKGLMMASAHGGSAWSVR